MLDQAEKGLAGTNTIAYFDSLSATKKKYFLTFTPDWQGYYLGSTTR
jgi:hypothetical protein